MTVRHASIQDLPAIARVHVESWKTTYAGRMPEAYLRDLTLEDRERLWRANFEKPAGPILAATEGDEVVGFAYGGPNRGKEPEYSNELYALYLLDRVQRKGLGRRLFLGVAESLEARSMIAWVLEGNPACGFYERMGGIRCGSKKIMIGGAFLDEVAYGWTQSPRSA
jgi:GNAT superfamily N-acetyltransferase